LVSSKNKVLFIGNMYWKGVQLKDFGRYLSVYSKIRSIILYTMNTHAIPRVHKVNTVWDLEVIWVGCYKDYGI
jgi:hypothetical protein